MADGGGGFALEEVLDDDDDDGVLEVLEGLFRGWVVGMTGSGLVGGRENRLRLPPELLRPS